MSLLISSLQRQVQAIQVSEDFTIAIAVAIITFILAPVILFFLAWIKESVGTAKKRQEQLTSTIATAVKNELTLIIGDKVSEAIKEVKEEFSTDLKEIKDDVRRIEDVILGRRHD